MRDFLAIKIASEQRSSLVIKIKTDKTHSHCGSPCDTRVCSEKSLANSDAQLWCTQHWIGLADRGNDHISKISKICLRRHFGAIFGHVAVFFDLMS